LYKKAKETYQIDGINTSEWIFVQCDASLLDLGHHAGIPDARETGVVSLPGAPIEIRLNGMPDYGVTEYVATSTDYDVPEAGHHKSVRRHQLIDMSGKVIGDEHYSQSGVIVIGKTRPNNVDVAAHYLAMKRAGDWGQVEHCAKYSMVFVTEDKPAYLYALFRNVPAILLVVDPRYIQRGCVAYSLVMFAPSGSKISLENSSPIKSPAEMKRERMIGGRRSSDKGYLVAVSFAAIATMITLAFSAARVC
jgi:hypothetical protein